MSPKRPDMILAQNLLAHVPHRNSSGFSADSNWFVG